MKEAKQAKPAKPAKPAKQAKAAKPAKAARVIGTLCVLILCGIFTGCATNFNRTPILSEGGDGASVIAYATNIKLGLGTKEATSMDSYKLSAMQGLEIKGFDQKTDSVSAFIEGLKVGGQLGSAYLGKNGAATGSSADNLSAEPASKSTPAVVTSAPKSAVSGEGVPIVAILGNRATCPRCVALWGNLDAAALSESLCGASVIDADKTDNPVEYARLRPQSAFAYPLVVVYDATGKLAGQFDARGMTQAQIAAKVKALVPSCASQ